MTYRVQIAVQKKKINNKIIIMKISSLWSSYISCSNKITKIELFEITLLTISRVFTVFLVDFATFSKTSDTYFNRKIITHTKHSKYFTMFKPQVFCIMLSGFL